MFKYIRTFRAPLAIVALVAAACSSDKKPDAALATDTALNKDLQLAGRDTTVQPALKDVPATPTPAPPVATPVKPAPRPVASAPKPKPAPARQTPAPVPTTTTTASGNTETRNPAGTSSPAGGAVGSIASGSSLSLRSNARICTNTYEVGQTFTASVANSVSGSNGASIPAGATVSLEITQLKRSENTNDKIIMEFAVRSVAFGGRTYPLNASVANADIDKVRNEPKSKDVQKVATGAIIGGIAGRILGKSTKGTVIGAAAGAAAGAGVASATANFEGCVPDGGNIAITLNSPVQVKIT